MATIGQKLTAPEAGWRRYDDTDSRIQYIGEWPYKYSNTGDTSAFYLGGVCQTWIASDYVKFKFYGSKLRIIAQPYAQRSNRLEVNIDNNSLEYYSIASSPATHQCLVYEKLNLTPDIHTVIIANKGSGTFLFDAIDIDSDGYLVLVEPENLTLSAGDSQVTLNWNAITGATGYNVKRSITPGGPYTTIASNVIGTNYVDSDVVNGTTYYYVVTAITAGEESENSNEALATPEAAPVEEGQAILRITVNDSSDREYKVSKAVANDFVTWCNRPIGTGNSCYVFDKGIQSSKEYLFYEKIISFEVIPVA